MSTAAQFTLDEYHKIVDSGVFVGMQKRIELIRGELRMMSPQGIRHAEVVAHMSDWSYDVVDRSRARIRIQLPIEISGSDSQPEPDLVWVQSKKYSQHPRPKEVLLLVEVADQSLSYDLSEKRDLYAAAGIQDYWVLDIPNRTIHILRDPKSNGFHSHQEIREADCASPLAFSQIEVSAESLFSCLG